jgi:hypothetical protein
MKNKTWLYLLLLIEICIFVFAYFTQFSINETFRISARFSARLSAVVYLYSFGQFIFGKEAGLKTAVFLFAIVHFIHFGFLATNVFLNQIELIPYKLAGGFLAYCMILLFPFYIEKLPKWASIIYFYYVGIVFIITYLSRIKGLFPGATPSIFHYIGLGAILLCFVAYPVHLVPTKSPK